jgi:hypothetical protein
VLIGSCSALEGPSHFLGAETITGAKAYFDMTNDAMVLVEGMKKAGKELTREGLIRGIESLHDFDMGLGPKLKLDYSSKEHKGFDSVIPTVVRGGRAVPFTDWSTAAPK